MENLTGINESIRQQLINLEATRNNLKELKAKNKAEGMLKERLNEYLSTALADLFIISDFLFEAENCIDEGDFELLLEITQDKTVN
ncbi:MAG: hypothetical protein ACYDA4_03860 [Ignavibacteriaceae bacterium]